MKIIDCRGLNCPEPVLRSKDALEERGGPFAVEVDNPASRDNVLRFGKSRGCRCSYEPLDHGCFRIELIPAQTAASDDESFDESDYLCGIGPTSGLVYVIPSDTMGSGDDELGWALLQTYIATISEVSPLPEKIFFYNGGVKIVATEGKALEAVKRLAEEGVGIYSCGTCLEFFKLENDLRVGKITNMYDILDSMVRARRLVSPF
ncbi:MAG: sulfurtransferase-like selenium metabolism protein YedF [Thermodesulfobacteriota bacterium]